ncbi:MAG: glycosyltransferase [Thermodesulfobacteriota bacterium]|nr:glycosyltransferase [Thermodesulfobacteriota bacterium]
MRGIPVMVSVVIPVHNRAGLVEEAIRSVLGQRGIRPEIIVVDDGSDDATPEVLKRFGSAVTVIRQERRGVSAARNRGARAASNPWLAFLDSDDLWLSEKLAEQTAYLRRHPELEICQTDEIWIQDGRRRNPGRRHEKPQGHCFSRLLERCLVSPSAVMIRRSLFEAVGGFDEALPACEDYDLWLRIGWRHPIGLVRKPLVVKRGGHPDQLSRTVPALDRFRIRALEKLLRGTPLSLDQRHLALEVFQEKCRVYGSGCLKRGKTAEGTAVLSLPFQVAEELGLSPADAVQAGGGSDEQTLFSSS